MEGLHSLSSCCCLTTLILGGEDDEVPSAAFEEPHEQDNKASSQLGNLPHVPHELMALGTWIFPGL